MWRNEFLSFYKCVFTLRVWNAIIFCCFFTVLEWIYVESESLTCFNVGLPAILALFTVYFPWETLIYSSFSENMEAWSLRNFYSTFTYHLLTLAIEFSEVIYGVVIFYSYSGARDDLSLPFPMCVELGSVVAGRTI
jgi:hypothetical protein